MVMSGRSPDRSLVEYVELPKDVHPFYVGTQAHPEFRSRPTRAHPLFAGLIEAAIARQEPPEDTPRKRGSSKDRRTKAATR